MYARMVTSTGKAIRPRADAGGQDDPAGQGAGRGRARPLSLRRLYAAAETLGIIRDVAWQGGTLVVTVPASFGAAEAGRFRHLAAMGLRHTANAEMPARWQGEAAARLAKARARRRSGLTGF